MADTSDAESRPRVARALIARIATRLWRIGPARRESYIGNARRRLATGKKSRNDQALLLATGEEPENTDE